MRSNKSFAKSGYKVSYTGKPFSLILLSLLFGVTLLLEGCSVDISSAPPAAPATSTSKPVSKTASYTLGSDKHAGPAALYPDSNLTPGDTFPGVSARQVCVSGYSKSVRSVTSDEKAAVFQRYATFNVSGKYEVDHFIPLELGGSNDLKNLWPEPYEPKPGAREKDEVENALHKAVCDGNMSLGQAQTLIRQDWYAYYLTLKGKGAS